MGILAWLVVGLIAGWLAIQVMRGAGGCSLIGDIIVGVLAPCWEASWLQRSSECRMR